MDGFGSCLGWDEKGDEEKSGESAEHKCLEKGDDGGDERDCGGTSCHCGIFQNE